MDAFADSPRRVSLQDVADALGLSRATVCRALLGRSRVADSTRQRVREAAQRLGYHPDPALSALSKHRWVTGEPGRASYAVALVHVRGRDAAVTGRAAEGPRPSGEAERQRARELGLQFSEWVLEEQASPRHLGHVLYSRGVQGVLFRIGGPPPDFEFPVDRFACVTIGEDRHVHPTHAVLDDWFRGLLQMGRQARARGYRRIGLAHFVRDNPAIDQLLGAAIALLREQFAAEGLAVLPVHPYPEGRANVRHVYEQERDRLGRWFEANRPDVVLDTNRVAYWLLKDLGKRMPDDVGYASLMGPGPEASERDLAGIDLHRDHQSRQAVDLLFNLMQLNMLGLPPHPMRLIVSCGWHEGQTLRAVAP